MLSNLKRKLIRMCWWSIILLVCMCGSLRTTAYAKVLPGEVRIVDDEKQMIQELVRGMRQHRTYFAFYYEGISADFRRYRNKSVSYQDFFDKIAKQDGYRMGIVSGSCVAICGTEDKYVTFQFNYLTTKSQEKKITKKVKRIVKKIGKGSRSTKIRKAHDYLLKNMKYDSRYYSPYHAFMKGRGVCMAYALAFQRLMQEMNIPCLYVKGENHAWNMVKLGKYWYNIDVTWDDSGRNRYRYFLKSDSDFPGHKRPKSKLYKLLRKAKQSYKKTYLFKN